jgi:hypothetical protein
MVGRRGDGAGAGTDGGAGGGVNCGGGGESCCVDCSCAVVDGAGISRTPETVEGALWSAVVVESALVEEIFGAGHAPARSSSAAVEIGGDVEKTRE